MNELMKKEAQFYVTGFKHKWIGGAQQSFYVKYLHFWLQLKWLQNTPNYV